MTQPQTILVFICISVFAATSVITLLGIINVVKIDKSFLKQLFAALILEIVGVSVIAYKTIITPPDNTIQINADIEFKDLNGNFIHTTKELVDELVQTNGITLIPPLLISNSHHFQIYIPRKFILERGTGIHIALKDFNDTSIINSALVEMINNAPGNTIDLKKIVLQEQPKNPNETYNKFGTQ